MSWHKKSTYLRCLIFKSIIILSIISFILLPFIRITRAIQQISGIYTHHGALYLMTSHNKKIAAIIFYSQNKNCIFPISCYYNYRYTITWSVWAGRWCYFFTSNTTKVLSFFIMAFVPAFTLVSSDLALNSTASSKERLLFV